MKLPNKFEICTKYARADKRIVELSNDGYYYMRHAAPFLDDAFDAPLKYSKGFVTEAIAEGSWIITKDLDEPELVFPINARHSGIEYRDEGCPEANITIEKGDVEGYVKVTWGDGQVDSQHWTVDNCKRLIKEGIWIVKSVGAVAPEKAPENTHTCRQVEGASWNDFQALLSITSLTGRQPCVGDTVTLFNESAKYSETRTYKGKTWELVKMKLGGNLLIGGGSITAKRLVNSDDKGGIVETSEAPQSASKNLTTLTISVNMGDSVAQAKALTDAVEALNISMESYIKLKEEMKNV